MCKEHALGRRLVIERFHSFPGAMILFRRARKEIEGRGGEEGRHLWTKCYKTEISRKPGQVGYLQVIKGTCVQTPRGLPAIEGEDRKGKMLLNVYTPGVGNRPSDNVCYFLITTLNIVLSFPPIRKRTYFQLEI